MHLQSFNPLKKLKVKKIIETINQSNQLLLELLYNYNSINVYIIVDRNSQSVIKENPLSIVLPERALSSAFLLFISCKWHKCWSEIQENFGKITLLAVWLYCCFTCMNALLCCRDSRSIGVCFVAWWNQPVLFVSQCLTDYIFLNDQQLQ